jgi:hypothetical protein
MPDVVSQPPSSPSPFSLLIFRPLVASSTIMSDCLFETLLTLAVVLQLWVISRGLADRRGIWLTLLAAVPFAYAVLLRAAAIVLPPLGSIPFLLIPCFR